MGKLSSGYLWVMVVLLMGLVMLAFVAGQREDEKLAALDEVSVKQQEIVGLQARLAEQTESRSNFDNLLHEKNVELNEIKRDRDLKAEKIQQYDGQVTDRNDQLQAVEDKYQDIAQSNAALSQQWEASQQALSAEREQLETTIQAYTKVEHSHQELTKKLAQKDNEIEVLSAKLSRVMNERNQTSAEVISSIAEMLVVSGKFGANLRVEASGKSKKLLTIPNGVKLEQLGSADNWLKVRVEGYVFNKLVAADIGEPITTLE